MKGEIYNVIWTDIEGWFSEADAEFVADICSNIHDGIVVELGVFAGRSTAVMAPICIDNFTRYCAIDNFEGSHNPEDEATIHQQNRDIKALFCDNMIAMELMFKISLQQLDSSEAASTARNNSIDFCFIDADHAPVAVRKDIEAWWPKIKINGFIGGHDYQSPLRSVVNQFAKMNNCQVIVGGRCWAIQKETT